MTESAGEKDAAREGEGEKVEGAIKRGRGRESKIERKRERGH